MVGFSCYCSCCFSSSANTSSNISRYSEFAGRPFHKSSVTLTSLPETLRCFCDHSSHTLRLTGSRRSYGKGFSVNNTNDFSGRFVGGSLERQPLFTVPVYFLSCLWISRCLHVLLIQFKTFGKYCFCFFCFFWHSYAREAGHVLFTHSFCSGGPDFVKVLYGFNHGLSSDF